MQYSYSPVRPQGGVRPEGGWWPSPSRHPLVTHLGVVEPLGLLLLLHHAHIAAVGHLRRQKTGEGSGGYGDDQTVAADEQRSAGGAGPRLEVKTAACEKALNPDGRFRGSKDAATTGCRRRRRATPWRSAPQGRRYRTRASFHDDARPTQRVVLSHHASRDSNPDKLALTCSLFASVFHWFGVSHL